MNTDFYCVYCDKIQFVDNISDEHIWPDALGGDWLPKEVWRLQVCKRCNNMSGVFVDGAFIKGWFGHNERVSFEAEKSEYENSFVYIGELENIEPPSSEEVVEFYTSKEASVLVLRPKEREDLWNSYTGGDPRRKKREKFRAYIIFHEGTKDFANPFSSFKKQFDRYERFVGTPTNQSDKIKDHIDNPGHPYPNDRKVRDHYFELQGKGQRLSGVIALDINYGFRFICKIALALGYKLFGDNFANSESASILRSGFREANYSKRQNIGVRGTSFVSQKDEAIRKIFHVSGKWVLALHIYDSVAVFLFVTPNGYSMIVPITREKKLLKTIDASLENGWIWELDLNRKNVVSASMPDWIASHLSEVE